MGICVEVSLWNPIARALKNDGDAVDVEGPVLEELPRDPA